MLSMPSRITRSIALAAAFVASISPALAQIPNFTLPPSTVVGRSANGTGPAQAIPFSTLIAAMLQSSLTIPTVNTNSVIYKGSTSGQATVSAQAVAGTPTIKWPTTSGTVPTSATSPVVLDSVTGIISCPTCATSTSAASPIVASRTLAQTLNLASFPGLVTVGYAAAGDGGGATFKNVGSAPFIDAPVNSITFTAGSGCTPGSYFGYDPQGGTGQGLEVNFTIGGGGTMTAASVTGAGGGGYTVNDVLTFTGPAPAIPGCTVQPTIRVAGLATPLGSFTDAVGNHFQIVSQQGAGVANIRQFGAVQNYTHAGGDAGATNDSGAIQACLRYVSVGSYFPDAGGYSGGVCLVPSGASLVCNGLLIPTSVTLRGTAPSGSMLKQCDADNINATNFVNLGDPSSHKNAFCATLRDLTLFGGGSSPGSAFMVYSNNTQCAYSLDNVAIYSVSRGCIKYEIGYGGPSGFGVHGGLCVPNGALSPSPAINLSGNFSFTFDNNWQISVGGTKWSGTGIQLGGGGTFQMNSGAHCENLTICVDWDGSVGSPMLVSIISNVGNAALDKYVSVRTGSISPGVNFQGFSANGTGCNVYKVATTSCVSTGNIGGLASF